MRKTSELYQLVLDYYLEYRSVSCLCSIILDGTKLLEDKERNFLIEHFYDQYHLANNEKYMKSQSDYIKSIGTKSIFWWDKQNKAIRIAFLKLLISNAKAEENG